MMRNLACTKCAKYCQIEVSWSGDQITFVRGHQCPIGLEWASSQVVDTKRVVTTSVRVENSPYPMIPVRTSRPVEKAKSLEVIREAGKLSLKAPIRCGQVIARNIAGTNADLIAVKEAQAL